LLLLFEGAAGGKMGAAEGAVKVGTEASIMSSSSSFAFLEGGCFDGANSEEVSMGWESVSVMSASSKSEGSVCEEETGAMTPGFLCSFLRFFRLTDGWEACGEHATTIFQSHWKKSILLIRVTCVTPDCCLALVIGNMMNRAWKNLVDTERHYRYRGIERTKDPASAAWGIHHPKIMGIKSSGSQEALKHQEVQAQILSSNSVPSHSAKKTITSFFKLPQWGVIESVRRKVEPPAPKNLHDKERH